MKAVLYSALALAMSNLGLAQDFQVIRPDEDQSFLQRLGLYEMGSPLPSRFNILVIGQDNSVNRRKRDERLLLGSRADVIMVLSIETRTGESQIFSIYRGNAPDRGCVEKLGYTPSGSAINEVYSTGREDFIPCLEGMLERRLALLPDGANLLDANGQFEIHAFFEGSRNHTIGPLARESVDIVLENFMTFAWLYGTQSLNSAFEILQNGDDIQSALNDPQDPLLSDELPTEVETDELSDYLIVELKERDAYKAAGYQRAFNFARVISVAMGWSAYGIHHRQSEGYEFLGAFFGETINRHMSASHDFIDLEREVMMTQSGHLLEASCYREGTSPVRLIQWGHRADAYLVFENGVFERSQARGLISHIKDVQILPDPPSCP